MTNEQCYEILKLKPGATEQEIREAHKTLSRVWHPDKYSDDPKAKKIAEDEIKKLNSARDQLLKSPNNPRSKQTNNPGAYQSTGVHTASPDNQSNKGKSSRWGLIAFGILALFVTLCGTSIFIGKSLLNPSTNSPFKTKEEIDAENVGKVSQIRFSSNVFLQLSYDSTSFRIQLMEMTTYNNRQASLKISVCNIGNKSGALATPKFWYTPVDGQNTINWRYGSFSLKPSECSVRDILGDLSNSYQLTRPFGKLSYSAEGSDILGSIDLSKTDSQGYIQLNDEPKTNTKTETPSALTESDSKLLQGTWQAQRVYMDTKEVTEEGAKNIQFIFNDAKIIIKGNYKGDPNRDIEGTYEIDSTKVPKHLDVLAGDKILAIYELNNDELKVCVIKSPPPSERPTSFISESDKKKSIYIFKKQ
jgi:uncharacterized protein (TIGR03067 family)